MKQLALDPHSGAISIMELANPSLRPDEALVRVRCSVVSSGTELAKVSLAGQSLVNKARSRPEQVTNVIHSARMDGIAATVRKVKERLGTPMPLGYSLAGVVEECGAACGGLWPGAAVACAGATASHAEMVAVPSMLVVPVPPDVALEDAAYTTLGAIAMHGLRTGNVQLGDRVLIIGLGLLGQIATRLCVAAGAHVFGVDLREDRAQLAVDSGADAAHTALDSATARAVTAWSGGRGADVVLITAGGTDNSPLVLAGDAARDRARVVVVGAVELAVPRETFYHKELSLVVSRSYGPGRYDRDYEERGIAYPVGFVPWTERRNMEEFLSLLSAARITLQGLKGETVPFEDAPAAYQRLSGQNPPISVVFRYGEPDSSPSTIEPPPERTELLPHVLTSNWRDSASRFEPRPLQVSFVGVGNFATGTLLPAIRGASDALLVTAVASTPLKAESVKRRWKFAASGSDPSEAWSGHDTQIVVLATRHDTHAAFAEAALRANKAVFVEKPLALLPAEFDRVKTTLDATAGRLMVGFNRRFAPAVRWAVDCLGSDRGNARLLLRVNAGPLPSDHWLLDPKIGGGRLLGEGCHFIDLACFLAGSEPVEVLARGRDRVSGNVPNQDFCVELTFANGTTALIEYVSSGDPTLGKERYEIHRQGISIVIDDFRRAECRRSGKVKRHAWAARDRGHRAEVHEFLEAVRTGAPTPIPEAQSVLSTALTLAAARSLREGRALGADAW